MFPLFFYLAVALVFSFLCSVWEAVLLSVTDSYIGLMKQNDVRGWRRLEQFKRNPERPLAAILTLNTVAHTVGAAGVGHQAAEEFGDAWLGIASAIMTLLILIGSEIIPKTLGALKWRQLAPMTAMMVGGLVVFLKPILIVLEWITSALFSHNPEAEAEIERGEIRAIIGLARSGGSLDAREAATVDNLLRLPDLPVKRIMTPRTVVFALEENTTVGEYRTEHRKSPYSRIPVYRESIDEITGFVVRADLLAEANRDRPISEIRRDLLAVPETISVSKLRDEFTRKNKHIALVVNEFGDFSGIVTLEDVIETVLGIEIIDETDEVADLREVARIQAPSEKRPES